LATLVICFAALTLAYVQRGTRDRATAIAARISTLGYALPGTVLAVGVYIPAAFLDHLLMDAAGRLGLEMGPLLTGTVSLMIIAYLIRFMAVGFGAVDAGLTRITGSVDEAARLLGARGARLLLRVHAPMLRRALLTAAILVFVDVLKEMPMTLMTRPFGWDTLPVKIFELTSEGEWERAALPALSLVLAGLVPVVLLIRNTERDPASGGKEAE
jgi:iron(III) transport system permease protein